MRTAVTCRADVADGCGTEIDGAATVFEEFASAESATSGTEARLGSGDWLSFASAAALPDVAVSRADRVAEVSSERSEVSGRVVRVPVREEDFDDA
ncbi:MAG: hypothetical protein NTY24_10145 [Mycobacterium sp.]|nr:hypothetical protein [Mycobacterium sp.]